MNNFLNISDHSSNELRAIIDEAKARKLKRKGLNKSAPDEDKPFEGKSMAMIFEKPSTRTRMSFDIAVKQLGGSSIILDPGGIHYGKGDESIKDTSKVLSEYSDIIVRDPDDFSVSKNGEEGIIQLLSLLPISYPGQSILTEDLGTILGEDDCNCGRKGKYFKINGRLKNAEVRGCSDTLNE